MLFTQGGLRPGDTVLVQGAGGGVATALITLARAGGPAGLRHQPGRGQAGTRPGDRRPRGLRVRRPAAGQGRRRDGDRRPRHLVPLDPLAAPRRARSSSPAPRRGPKLDDAELTRIFFLQLQVIGSTMGTRDRAGRRWSACSTPPAPARSSTATLPMEQAARRLRRDGRRRRLRQDRLHPLTPGPRTHLVTGAGSGIGALLVAAPARAWRRGGPALHPRRASTSRTPRAVARPGRPGASGRPGPRPAGLARARGRQVDLGSVSPTSTSGRGSASWRSTSPLRPCSPPRCSRRSVPPGHGGLRELRRRAPRQAGVVGLRRLQVRPAGPRRRAARGGARTASG